MKRYRIVVREVIIKTTEFEGEEGVDPLEAWARWQIEADELEWTEIRHSEHLERLEDA